jgi:hypothetical protein
MNEPWLFGRRTDLLLFGGSAAMGIVVLAAGRLTAGPGGDAPFWMIPAVLVSVDLSHVWATGWRVLGDGDLPGTSLPLTLFVALGSWAAGIALFSSSELLFWRVLAYLAIFHVVRQQYGWVALYRRKNGEGEEGRRLDAAVIYGATLAPLVSWHTRTQRFEFFLQGELLSGLPEGAATAAYGLFGTVLAAWSLKEVLRARSGRRVSWGKVLIVAATTTTWLLGTIALNAEWAFSVTNIFIHGIPYLGLVWLTSRRDAEQRAGNCARARLVDRATANPAIFLAPIVVIALIQCWGWDVYIPRDPLLARPETGLSAVFLAVLVPLLAVPQATHYVLDALLWKVRPGNRRAMAFMGRLASAAARPS